MSVCTSKLTIACDLGYTAGTFIKILNANKNTLYNKLGQCVMLKDSEEKLNLPADLWDSLEIYSKIILWLMSIYSVPQYVRLAVNVNFLGFVNCHTCFIMSAKNHVKT